LDEVERCIICGRGILVIASQPNNNNALSSNGMTQMDTDQTYPFIEITRNNNRQTVPYDHGELSDLSSEDDETINAVAPLTLYITEMEGEQDNSKGEFY